MTAEELTFRSWQRDDVAAAADRTEDGRLVADVPITLTESDLAGNQLRAATETVSVAVAGPADVRALAGNAITRRYPTPGVADHETNRMPHAETRDPRLPWRHSPTVAATSAAPLVPWLCVVVARDDPAEIDLAGDRVVLQAAVTSELDPATRDRWAHVQEDTNGEAMGRLLCARTFAAGELPADEAMIALIVPSYVLDGGGALVDGWAPGQPSASLPVLDLWWFRTSPIPGDFRTLARRLRSGDAPPTTGSAPVHYARLPTLDPAEARGALAPAGSQDLPADPAIEADLTALLTTGDVDEANRPIVGMPELGGPWTTSAAASPTWANTLNRDHRHRGVAGVGRRTAIAHQEELTAEIAEHLGSIDEANQRIRFLAGGMLAARSLWRRRLPTTEADQLLLFGPSFGRLMTDQGSVLHRIGTGNRPTGSALFSSAARRVLRPGPARTTLAQTGAADATAVVAEANTCPAPPVTPLGPLDADFLPGEAMDLMVELGFGHLNLLETIDVEDLLHNLVFLDATPEQEQRLETLRQRTIDQLHNVAADDPSLFLVVLVLVAWSLPGGFLDGFRQEFVERNGPWVCYAELDLGTSELWDCLAGHGIQPPTDTPRPVPPFVDRPETPPCDPIDPGALVPTIVDAFDPMVPEPRPAIRVYDTIDGADLDPDFLPIEPCPSLPRPAWTLLEREAPEWLLPGIGQLEDDIVIGLEANQRFVEAAMVGINQQVLGELRWRATTLDPACTPLRRWWGRTDPGTGAEVADIAGIASWATATTLGSHNPTGGGNDAVVVFKGDLFHRYPTTLVYLTPADPQWSNPAPDRDRSLDTYPTFRGTIGNNVAFFGFGGRSVDDVRASWVVLEEPPAGYSFRFGPTQPSAADHARATFATPVRILIRGDRVVPGGGP